MKQALLLAAVLCVAAHAQTTVVGLDANGLGTSTNVHPKSLRFWDTGTTWPDLNPAPGVYNWAPLDKLLQNAKVLGISDLLMTLSNTPQWASSGPHSDCKQGHNLYGCSPPKDVDTTDANWKAFVAALLAHTGQRIGTFEMWNEPGWVSHYNGSYAQMVRMVTDAAKIIHAAGLKVATPPNEAQFAWDMRWWNGYAAAGGLAPVDIVAFHGYVNIYPLRCGVSPIVGNVSLHVKNLTALMAKYSLTRPLWDSEGSWGPASRTCFNDKAAQAVWLTKFYALHSSLGVARTYWYAYAGDWGALVDSQHNLLPSGVAYNQLP